MSDLSWPAARLGEALRVLGRRAGREMMAADAMADAPPQGLAAEGGVPLGAWIESAADRLGLEAIPVAAPYPEIDTILGRSAPALVRLADSSEPRFLVLLGGGRRHVLVMGPDLAPVRVARERIRAAICVRVEAPWTDEVERILAGMALRGGRRRRVRERLLGEYLATTQVGGCWLIRAGGSSGLRAEAREAGLPRLLAGFLAAQALAQGLWVLSWWLLGTMTLEGRLDPGWLGAWLLLLVTLVPVRLLATSTGGLLAIRGGAVLRRRLLFGTLNLEPDEVRHLGIGQLLGRVIESGALESMALTGGLLGFTAIIELIIAGLVLGAGAGGRVHVALLAIAILVAAGLGHRYARRLRRWTADRLGMTNELVERMAGHRTRLAQQAEADWHEGEDRGLADYLAISRDLEGTAVALQVLVPRGWLLMGLVGMAPALLAGDRSPESLAVGVGGLMLAYRALRDLTDSGERIAAAAIAWDRIAPFWRAATRREPAGHPRFSAVPARTTGTEVVRSSSGSRDDRPGSGNGRSLLDVLDVVFRYGDREEPVLQDIGMRIRAGDRLLLEGPSGEGKSTLAALLAGGRVPDAGLLLLDGLDRETLGAEGWRRRIVLAPQFHENHVFMGTLAFNALMGRGWPPRPSDLEEAEDVCRALGLGPLLDRMPAGLNQMVGETGWQLSHGERSRLYIARALLQGADLLILDESFAALDPETLHRTLAFVVQEAPALLVVAHP